MLNGDKSLLRVPDNSCLTTWAEQIASGIISFSCPLFNTAHNESILNFTTRPGEILCNSITDDRLLKLIMTKIATDKLEDFKFRKNLDCRNTKQKKEYEGEKGKLNISIVDFSIQCGFGQIIEICLLSTT